MEQIPIPKTKDATLWQALVLLNKEIEDLKKEVAALKAAQEA